MDAARASGLGALSIDPRFLAVGVLFVVVPWYFCRRRSSGGDDDDGFEMDETGRRRRIMHGDL